jgi:transcriptional regulator with XRE-family HTH domain
LKGRAGEFLDALPDRDTVSRTMNDSLPKLIRTLREELSLSQRELAVRAGVGPRAVWDLERGKPTIRLDVVTRVLAVFGRKVTVAEPDAPPSGAW